MGSTKIAVLRPTGVDIVDTAKAAKREASLEGKRIGLVWNHKDYGDRLLDAVEELFKEKHPEAILSRWQLKECCKKPPEGELESVAAQVDAVVYTLGD